VPLLQAVNLSHAFGAETVLNGASLSLEPGDRVGLVGRNGCGKSTLVRILAGSLTPDEGAVTLQRGRRAALLEQDPDLPPDETLRGAAEAAFADLHRLHEELHAVFDRMASADGDGLTRLLREQERLERAIDAAGGYAVDHKIDATLHGLGFTDAQFTIACKDLSGGQRGRLALARLLLESPDLLLLDEPTNHLDIDGRMWLESFLREEFSGAVLLISHDRRLLQNVVTRIVEVEDGRLIDYPGSYDTFRRLRAERRRTILGAYERQQAEFRRQAQFIQKYKTGQRAKEARGRQKHLDRARAEAIEKPLDIGAFRFNLPKAPRAGELVITARGLCKRYALTDDSGEPAGEKVLFHDLDLTIARGERWGIIGPNGAGKTTLVRCLLGDMAPDAGTVRLGANLAVGYYRQTDAGVDPERPVYRFIQDAVRAENPDAELTEQQARDLAGAFLFSGLDQEKPMGVLSGGERSRARLAALLASAKNLLVLDEPTNHLDIPSAERLEEALTTDGAYTGALLLISHDRALIDATCDHVLALDGDGGAEAVIGNFSDWLARRRARDSASAPAREPRPRRQANTKRDRAPGERPTGSAGGLNLSLNELESRIESLQARLAEIDTALSDPGVWIAPDRASALAAERAALADELEPLEHEWFERAGSA